MVRSKGRTGRPWLRARARCLKASQICALCGEVIDLTIPWPDPMSPSVDHIIPVSQLAPGDKLLTSLDNLRSCHLGCNARRGDGTAPTSQDASVTTQDFYA